MENPDINLERLAEQYPEATRELLELTEALNSRNYSVKDKKVFDLHQSHVARLCRRQTSPDICRKLEQVAQGKIKRLIVNVPTKAYKV